MKTDTRSYNYRASIKSGKSDELINTYLLRPIAGLIVGMLYRTPVTPNQVTIVSILAGLLAAAFYVPGDSSSLVIAGLLVTTKDILDSADGQLARAKNLYSRRGRFLDSIGDFVVNLAVFAAIGWTLYETTGDSWMWLWAFLALAGITLRVSYHVFYHTSHLHLKGAYQINRVSEDITDNDRRGDRVTLVLQKIFQTIYGWQDRLMLAIDSWCRRGRLDEEFRQRWYGNTLALRLSGFLGIGTELFLLMLCSVVGDLELYTILNITLMNSLLLLTITYRRWVL